MALEESCALAGRRLRNGGVEILFSEYIFLQLSNFVYASVLPPTALAIVFLRCKGAYDPVDKNDFGY